MANVAYSVTTKRRQLYQNTFKTFWCGCLLCDIEIGGYMITSVVRKDGAVICIHDDYCSHTEATEISHILLKISDLVSNTDRSVQQERDKNCNIP